MFRCGVHSVNLSGPIPAMRRTSIQLFYLRYRNALSKRALDTSKVSPYGLTCLQSIAFTYWRADWSSGDIDTYIGPYTAWSSFVWEQIIYEVDLISGSPFENLVRATFTQRTSRLCWCWCWRWRWLPRFTEVYALTLATRFSICPLRLFNNKIQRLHVHHQLR